MARTLSDHSLALIAMDTAHIERRLQERRAELNEQLGELTRTPERGSGVGFGKRVGDGTIEAVSRLSEVSVADNLQASAARVERALEKLEGGTYGTCDMCGTDIPAARLEVAPESVLCIEHARSRRTPAR